MNPNIDNIISTFEPMSQTDLGDINLQRHVMGLPTFEREIETQTDWNLTESIVGAIQTKLQQDIANLQVDIQPQPEPIANLTTHILTDVEPLTGTDLPSLEDIDDKIKDKQPDIILPGSEDYKDFQGEDVISPQSDAVIEVTNSITGERRRIIVSPDDPLHPLSNKPKPKREKYQEPIKYDEYGNIETEQYSTKDLEQEALKYDSAEEFVKGQEGKTHEVFYEKIYGDDVEIIKNPTSKEIRQLDKEARQEYPNMKQGEPTTRFTYDEQGNKYVWRADKGVHGTVEPVLKKKVGMELNQNEHLLERPMSFTGKYVDAIVAKSAKESGKWQVTFMGKDGIPNGDAIRGTYKEAIDEARYTTGKLSGEPINKVGITTRQLTSAYNKAKGEQDAKETETETETEDATRSVLSEQEIRCTNATLKALGVDCKDKAMWGTSVLSKLKEAGKLVEPVPMSEIKTEEFGDKTKTLGEFIEAHPTGSYYVFTSGHSMALVDGELTDTAGGTNKRRVQGAFKVTYNKAKDNA